MHCEEFRQSLDADPAADFPGRTEHAAECAACAHYAAQAVLFEKRLAAALAIEAPAFLATVPGGASEAGEAGDDSRDSVGYREKIASLDERRGRIRARRLPAWLAVAAALVLGVALTLQLNQPASRDLAPDALAAEVVAHMDHEPYSRVVTSVPVPEQTLTSVLTPAASALDRDDMGLVTYARTCPINGHDVPHLVVQGRDGPVTLLLMPEEQVEAPVPLEGGGFHGVILPVGDGSIAIVGERGHSVEDVTGRIRRSLSGTI